MSVEKETINQNKKKNDIEINKKNNDNKSKYYIKKIKKNISNVNFILLATIIISFIIYYLYYILFNKNLNFQFLQDVFLILISTIFFGFFIPYIIIKIGIPKIKSKFFNEKIKEEYKIEPFRLCVLVGKFLFLIAIILMVFWGFPPEAESITLWGIVVSSILLFFGVEIYGINTKYGLFRKTIDFDLKKNIITLFGFLIAGASAIISIYWTTMPSLGKIRYFTGTIILFIIFIGINVYDVVFLIHNSENKE